MRSNALALVVAVALAGRAHAQANRLEPECPAARDSFRLYREALPRAAVAGEVTNRDTAEPLRNAFILLTPGDHRASTDSLGTFRIDHVPDGQYTVLIRYLGFAQYLDTLVVDAGVGTRLHVPLVPAYFHRCSTVRVLVRPPPRSPSTELPNER